MKIEFKCVCGNWFAGELQVGQTTVCPHCNESWKLINKSKIQHVITKAHVDARLERAREKFDELHKIMVEVEKTWRELQGSDNSAPAKEWDFVHGMLAPVIRWVGRTSSETKKLIP